MCVIKIDAKPSGTRTREIQKRGVHHQEATRKDSRSDVRRLTIQKEGSIPYYLSYHTINTMFAVKSAANGLLRTSKSVLAQPLRAQGLRPMTILSKQSGEEYKEKVRRQEANPREYPQGMTFFV